MKQKIIEVLLVASLCAAVYFGLPAMFDWIDSWPVVYKYNNGDVAGCRVEGFFYEADSRQCVGLEDKIYRTEYIPYPVLQTKWRQE